MYEAGAATATAGTLVEFSKTLSAKIDYLNGAEIRDKDSCKRYGDNWIKEFKKVARIIIATEPQVERHALAMKFIAFVVKHSKAELFTELSNISAGASRAKEQRLLIGLIIKYLESATAAEADRQEFRLFFARDFQKYIQLIVNKSERPAQNQRRVSRLFMNFVAKPTEDLNLLEYYKREYAEIIAINSHKFTPCAERELIRQDAAKIVLGIQEEYVSVQKDLSIRKDQSVPQEEGEAALQRIQQRRKDLELESGDHLERVGAEPAGTRFPNLSQICIKLKKDYKAFLMAAELEAYYYYPSEAVIASVGAAPPSTQEQEELKRDDACSVSLGLSELISLSPVSSSVSPDSSRQEDGGATIPVSPPVLLGEAYQPEVQVTSLQPKSAGKDLAESHKPKAAEPRKSKIASNISTALGWTGGISAGLGLAGCIAIGVVGLVAWPVAVGVLGLLAIGAGCLCASKAISDWSSTAAVFSTVRAPDQSALAALGVSSSS